MAARRRKSRAEAKEESRNALIQAGIELFGAQGLDGPSLDAICRRAGYTRGAFYIHFEDRDDFLVAVMDRVGSQFLDAVLAGTEGASALAAVAGRFFVAVARGEYPLMRRRGVRPHQLLDACARSEKIRARYVALVEESIARLVPLLAADPALRKDVEPRDLARLLLCTIVGAQTLMELRVDLDLPCLGQAALRLTTRSLER
jgi:AcrR family transcriptional regulator